MRIEVFRPAHVAGGALLLSGFGKIHPENQEVFSS